MTIMVELDSQTATWLQDQAEAQGLSAGRYVQWLIERMAACGDTNAATLALLATWDAEDETKEPAEIEARCADWEAIRTSIDSNRLIAR